MMAKRRRFAGWKGDRKGHSAAAKLMWRRIHSGKKRRRR
jgi:hypothetical protein